MPSQIRNKTNNMSYWNGAKKLYRHSVSFRSLLKICSHVCTRPLLQQWPEILTLRPQADSFFCGAWQRPSDSWLILFNTKYSDYLWSTLPMPEVMLVQEVLNRPLFSSIKESLRICLTLADKSGMINQPKHLCSKRTALFLFRSNSWSWRYMSGYHADTPITIKVEAIHEADSRIH